MACVPLELFPIPEADVLNPTESSSSDLRPLNHRQLLVHLGSSGQPGQDALSDEETELLDRCEKTISAGVRASVAAALALKVIKREKLFRSKHPSFEAYARQTLEISRQEAYRLMRYADVCENLARVSLDHLPNPRQARELAGLPAHAQQVVWHDLVRSRKKISASTVAAQVCRYNGQPLTALVGSSRGLIIHLPNCLSERLLLAADGSKLKAKQMAIDVLTEHLESDPSRKAGE